MREVFNVIHLENHGENSVCIKSYRSNGYDQLQQGGSKGDQVKNGETPTCRLIAFYFDFFISN